MSERFLGRAYRPGSVWEGQERRGWWPGDRELRVKLWTRFEAVYNGQNRRQKGRLTPAARRVFEVLLFKFLNLKKGDCFPSYDTIGEIARLSRRAVAYALRDLAAYGFLTWQRRRKVVRAAGCVAYVQSSNAYSFIKGWLEERGAECKLSAQTTPLYLNTKPRWLSYLVDKSQREEERRRRMVEQLRQAQPELF